mmetsp:Transcript_76297/g.158957  ORF Transcript_76297/g.158957 Transcript_76297/m.158957 type:complete len:355 (-) Transcript_76297:125-1189(-)
MVLYHESVSVLHAHSRAGIGVPAVVIGSLESVQQLATSFLHSPVSTEISHLRSCFVSTVSRACSDLRAEVCDEGMLQGVPCFDALGFVPLQGFEHELPGIIWCFFGWLQHLGHRLALRLEREFAAEQAIHQDAECPTIDLVTIISTESLWWPILVCATLVLHPLPRSKGSCSAHIVEVNTILRVFDIWHVHEVIVTLHIAMHEGLCVHESDGLPDLPRQSSHCFARNHTLTLPMPHHALDHITAHVDAEDDTNEALLVQDLMHVNDGRVHEFPQHINLTFDDVFWRLCLIDHLHRPILAGLSVLAFVDHTEGTFAKLLAQSILLEQPHLRFVRLAWPRQVGSSNWHCNCLNLVR